ncbi:MAG: Gfo/Idh/MocA family oxidoreductase [Planctomycetota bacterium]|nr:Gfo/Idh/MocA family oxidoreductase [Planctomycetota bacterium]
MNDQPQNIDSSTRRDFLKRSSAAVAGTALAANLMSSSVYAAGSDTLKLGLVGCGGRGNGAASNALHADDNVELVAVADAFESQINGSLRALGDQARIKDRIKVADDHKFVGLEGYKQVIDAVDVVILATPPGFRPVQLRAAVNAGKHIFTEKPMATDAPGARSVYESVVIAKEKNIAMVAGYCWRYDYAKKALFEKVHAGDIGDVRSVFGTYLTGPVKPMPPANTRPEGMSNLEWMVRNWYNFTWLSGDGLVEQAIHTVDWLAWAMGDRPPVSCSAVGGRQIPAEGGNIYDHVQVNYVWDNDARASVTQRQIPGCFNENFLYILGTKGTGKISRRGSVVCDLNGDTIWKYEGKSNNMYQTEHDEFFASIRSGKHINDGDRMANSTLMGIMGRIAGYTGDEISWEQALNSQDSIVPQITDGWNSPAALPEMARPGITKYV